jgi:hypothetical protein
MYEVIFEIIPWSLDDVETFDDLYKNIIIDKSTPRIPKDSESKYFMNLY